MAGKIPTAWSYSALSNYELCPRQYKYRKIDKLREPKGEPLVRGIKIHDQAAKFLSGEVKAFPSSCEAFRDQFYELRDMHPIVEQRWAFNANWKSVAYFAKDVRCRVIADVGLVYDDNTADIIDHKTGKVYGDDYDDQLGLFAGAFFKKFPQLREVTTRLWYLDADEEVIDTFTKPRAMEVLADLEERAEDMLADRRWVATPNSKCRWCHFRKSNGGPCEFS